LDEWTDRVTTFGYDPLGNLANVIDARSNPLAFGYDAVGRGSSPVILPGRPDSVAGRQLSGVDNFTGPGVGFVVWSRWFVL
jgi:YD repeat-containing protein